MNRYNVACHAFLCIRIIVLSAAEAIYYVTSSQSTYAGRLTCFREFSSQLSTTYFASESDNLFGKLEVKQMVCRKGSCSSLDMYQLGLHSLIDFCKLT